MTRAQSHVVGVALMLGLTVLALGTVAAGVGSVFESHATGADAQRVADQLAVTLETDRTTGPRSGRIAFSDGRLASVERQLRVLRDGSVVAETDVDALVFRTGDRRVAYLAGAIVRGQEPNAWLVRDPQIAGATDPGVLVVGAPKLNASHAAVAGGGTATLRTNVTHNRTGLGDGTFAVAIETETPAAFERYFAADGASTSRRRFDSDEVDSVVAEYPASRTGYLVVHDMRTEVGNG